MLFFRDIDDKDMIVILKQLLETKNKFMSSSVNYPASAYMCIRYYISEVLKLVFPMEKTW